MYNKHPHAEFIKAWADGRSIERFDGNIWVKDTNPTWDINERYRIGEKDIIKELYLFWNEDLNNISVSYGVLPNVRVTFDGNTKVPKKVELL